MNTLKQLKLTKLFSVLAMVIGTALLIYMISVEREPGAIPLLLIVLGAGCYGITRFRTSRME